MPPAIQDRMRKANERGPEHEKAEGLAIARELAAGIAKLERSTSHHAAQRTPTCTAASWWASTTVP